ncbi:FixH family protein [Thermomicrobium sp. 4228-Ro]|uniref:FixH family protein n=1 Tax=Thermomicrobium sp. 4228-Ro TaxID=2993937 RepID=UPI002248F2BB|nr:FixH family protein [Thermomicrobium sp. 4228-Ro]MCX2727627.1 FixH family protein [Thermomicrobium sp. 4228-Ro]
MGLRWTKLFLLLSLVLLVPLTAACRRGEATTHVRAELAAIEPDPPAVGPATLRFRLLDSTDGRPVTGLGTVEVEGTMSHAGMEPVITTAREEEDGIYVTEGFRFTMAGDWIVIVRGTRNGERFETRFELSGVRSSAGSPGHQHGTATP